MHGRRAVFNDQSADPAVVIIHQFRRSHGLGDNHDVLGRDIRRLFIIAAQIRLQTVGHVAQIMQTFAQIAVAALRQTVPHVFIRAFHCRFRRQTAANIAGDFAVPALVFGKHPVSIQNIDMLAETEFGRIKFGVQIFVHLMVCNFQPAQFLFPVFGKNVGYRLATPVNHSIADTVAFVKTEPLYPFLGAHPARLDQRFLILGHFFGSQNLGQNHRNGFQQLNIHFRPVDFARVIQSQHADRTVPLQDRHTDKRLEIFFFQQLRLGNKFRIHPNVVDYQRAPTFRHFAGHPFVIAQAQPVRRRFFKTAGGKQFEIIIVNRHITGGGIRLHFGRNGLENTAQFFRYAFRRFHNLSQLFQNAQRLFDSR